MKDLVHVWLFSHAFPAMKATIRKYNDVDLDGLAASFLGLQRQTASIQKSAYYKDPKDFDSLEYTRCFLEELSRSGGMVFVAETEAAIVGHVVVRVEMLSAKERQELSCATRGSIVELFVQPSFQKKGIGSQLLQAAEEYCKQQRCDWISVAALMDNAEAQDFYRKNGYGEHAVEFLKNI